MNVYDLNGHLVLADAINNQATTLGLSQLNSGIYLVEVSSEGERETFKIGLD